MLKFIRKWKSPFAVAPKEETWFGMDKFADHHLLSPLAPVSRLLLTADGSMTQMLEALLLKKISMEIVSQQVFQAAERIDGLPDAARGAKLLSREAWLTDGQRPLIYAHSLLHVPEGGVYSLDAIREVNAPLGRMVRGDGVKTLREGYRFGLVRSPAVAAKLGTAPDADFWGRYYTLSTDSNLSGVIFELFSPLLFEY